MKETITNKFETLKEFLIKSEEATPEELKELTANNCFNEGCNTFEIIGNEYKVLTGEEVDSVAQQEILDLLWAFNAKFIAEHTEFYKTASNYERIEFIETLKSIQEKFCEGANSIVKALISDLDEFVEDAIEIDGRENFIAYYDGEEHEYNDLYIYKTN